MTTRKPEVQYAGVCPRFTMSYSLDDLSREDKIALLSDLLTQTGLWPRLHEEFGAKVDVIWPEVVAAYVRRP